MARGEWVHNGRFSYKRTIIVVCSINIVVALFVFHSLYTSIYTYSLSDSQTSFEYTTKQIKKMEEANEVRQASEPKELIKLVAQLKKRLMNEERVLELPQNLKWKLTDEILERLRSLDAAANATEQREAVESWRRLKLKEARKLIRGKPINSTIFPQEAGVVARALSSDWNEFLELIGLWIPVSIIHKEHDDKPEGEDEFEEEVLPGRKLPPECHAELHTDYDGAAVRWGLTHPKESAYDCCMACLDQARRAKPGQMKCNIWVYCPSETGCYSPDIYEHKNQECWLKYSEKPKLNFKDTYPEWYRNAHRNAPVIVPWAAGVVSV
ncbi:peptidyl-prolyl cis-trans isomerases [Striga asiatica]|uniref:Peptidyl-prolyl cis-trans isomerases n=1 Tax=Striga asiatica TaxID=4170 RepID=A0A5A7PCM3_STRAF|nr:peptidyl-prolyl cis-trans isomerases [Striga asiatica]